MASSSAICRSMSSSKAESVLSRSTRGTPLASMAPSSPAAPCSATEKRGRPAASSQAITAGTTVCDEISCAWQTMHSSVESCVTNSSRSIPIEIAPHSKPGQNRRLHFGRSDGSRLTVPSSARAITRHDVNAMSGGMKGRESAKASDAEGKADRGPQRQRGTGSIGSLPMSGPVP